MIVPSAKNAEKSLSDALEGSWKKYKKRLKACREQVSEPSVHELRTSLRRLLSVLRILSRLEPSAHLKKTRRELKDQLDSLGPLRDIHFQKKFLSEHPDLKAALGLYYRHLSKIEKRETKKVSKRLDDVSTKPLSKTVSKINDELHALLVKPSAPKALPQALKEGFASVCERDKQVDGANSDSVHKVRIALKKFRYMAEALQSLLGLKEETLKTLKSSQDLTGSIQDLAVMLGQLEAFYKKHHSRQPRRVEMLRKSLNEEEETSTKKFLEQRSHTYDVIQKELRIHP